MQTLLSNEPKHSSHSGELRRLGNILENIQANISQANRILADLSKESEIDQYKEIPGVEGTFDGVFMTTKDGQKIEVPVNYSAKSRLVYGDTLKMIKVKDEGQEEKTLFKQLVKVPRKRIEGVLSKKDGKWYLLTESNSYRILDRAAEFNGALPNDVAFGLIPEGIMTVPFASLDSVKKVELTQSAPIVHNVPVVSPVPVQRPNLPKVVSKPPRRNSVVNRVSARKKEEVSTPYPPTEKKEFISELKPVVEKKIVTAVTSVEEDDLR